MPIMIENVFSGEYSGRTYYTGWMRAADVYDAIFVPVTKRTKLPKKVRKDYVEPLEEREGGYQRSASRHRMHEIAKYCIENPRAVIPPVLLSDRGKWKWGGSTLGALGKVTITEKAAVVDGQHRLGGFRLQATREQGEKERKIMFVVVADLSVDEEKNMFLTINNTQKGVPRAHTAFLMSQDWWNAVAIQISESGPFEGRIQAAGGIREPWHSDLKLHSVANAIRDVFKEPAKGKADVWKFVDDDERRDELPDIVNRYWELISETFADEWSDIEMLPLPEHLGVGGGEGKTRDFNYKLLELTGFIAWMWFLDEVAVHVWNPKAKTLNETELIRYLTWIREAEEPNPEQRIREGEPEYRKVVDWRKKGKFVGRTGGAGAKPILDAMVGVVQSKIQDQSA